MEKTKLTINLPFISLTPLLETIEHGKQKANVYFQTAYSAVSSAVSDTTASSKVTSRKIKKFFKNSFFIPMGIVLILVAIIIFFVMRSALSHSSNATTSGDDRMNVQKAKATQQINKTFTFPLKDDTGKQISTIAYQIQSAELRDQIIVKGTPATAVRGRTFLIINLKITNGYTKSVSINARDYIRLSVNNSSEKLAADIHNDPVEVQAISTKYTRLGFPINDSDKNLTLQVGEITGPKQTLKLNHLQ